LTNSPILLEDRARALAHYPHARVVGDLILVSGVSSRRADDSHEGVTILADGSVGRDIRAQTRAALDHTGIIRRTAGATLDHVVDITVYLVDMQDYAGMNAVWNETFTAAGGPARTTVAVHQLPHPNLLVEMKAVACVR